MGSIDWQVLPIGLKIAAGTMLFGFLILLFIGVSALLFALILAGFVKGFEALKRVIKRFGILRNSRVGR